MKAPSKNVSASLRGQRLPGQEGMPISVSQLKSGKSSGVLPGERGVERPPGMRHSTNASHYADPLAKAGGS